MAGISRATQLLFSTTGLTPTAGFGGPAAGTTTTEAGSSNSLSNIQSGTAGAWAAGWLNATLGSSKFPTIEDMNAVFNVITNQLGYILERGIAEYDAGTTYNIGDICRQAATGNIYLSLINTNLGNALSNGTDWQYCGNIEQLTQIPYWCGTSGGSANAQTLTTGFGLGALTAGQSFEFIAGFTSTTATMTFAIDSVAATEAYENSASGLVPVPANGIIAGNVYTARWNGVKLVVGASLTGYLLSANNLSDVASPATSLVNLGIAQPVKANFNGLICTWASNTTSTLTANEIILENSSGQTVKASSVNVTFNSATSGANGLDTGSITNTTWYYGYVIYNPTTTTFACLFSASAMAPTLPSGYTYSSGAITAFRTDSSAHFLGFKQFNRRWQYVVGSNLSALPTIATGSTSSAWVAQAVSGFVPINAATIKLVLVKFEPSGVVAVVGVAPNANYSTVVGTLTNPPPMGWDDSSVIAGTNSIGEFALESSNIYYLSNYSNTGIFAFGFEINI